MRILAIILIGVLSTVVTAQKDALRFEVASVKPSKPDPQKPPIVLPPVGGRFLATNTPLRLLIRIAYGIEEFQISGGPSWIDSSTFEITAKIPDGTPDTLSSVTPMLRTLLAERFKLQTHTERKEQPIYVLTFARDDEQLGPNLKPSTADCSNAAEEMRKRVAAVASGRIVAIPNPGDTVPCAAVGDTSGGGFGLRANGQPLAALIQFLMPITERVVADKTGLTGLYDWVLRYDPGVPQPSRTNQNPDLFTALREQLGLKLEQARAPVEVLIIDSVDQPSPD